MVNQKDREEPSSLFLYQVILEGLDLDLSSTIGISFCLSVKDDGRSPDILTSFSVRKPNGKSK